MTSHPDIDVKIDDRHYVLSTTSALLRLTPGDSSSAAAAAVDDEAPQEAAAESKSSSSASDSATVTIELKFNSIAFITIDSSKSKGSFVYLEAESTPLATVKVLRVELDPSRAANESHLDDWIEARTPQLSSRILPVSSTFPTEDRSDLHVVLNPASGACSAPTHFESIVRPLLELSGRVNEVKVHKTRGEGDGVRIGQELRAVGKGGKRTVLVLGGDGTVGEVVNGLLLGRDGGYSAIEARGETELILVPVGTANALYYHHFPPESSVFTSTPLEPLQSLLSYLHRKSERPKPLPIALNSLPSSTAPFSARPNEISTEHTVLTTVVTSTALHAALLFDAEELRKDVPGMDRFKIAAAQNANRWFQGLLTLRAGQGEVEAYDPSTKTFRPFDQGKDGRPGPDGVKIEIGGGGKVSLGGPFSYLVTTLSSRFEPHFVVAPLRGSNTDLSTIEVVVIRPLRHPETRQRVEQGDERKARDEFVEKVWGVVGGMYNGGRHVDVKWDDGEPAVEYFRCKEVEWTAGQIDSDDIKDRLVCLDGAIRSLGSSARGGGSFTTTALGSRSTGLGIWA